MRVVFRTDSSAQIGSGHLMRCLTLANELHRQGVEILFLSRELPGHLITRIHEAGHPVCRLPAPFKLVNFINDDYSTWLGVTQEEDADQTIIALDNQRCDWVVVDHYGLDVKWESKIKPLTEKLLVIDDLANRLHDCNVLLDQNYFGKSTKTRYQNYTPDFCRCLLGPEYALVQPEYAQLRTNLLPCEGLVNRVLVFFGGSDSTEETAKVLRALNGTELLHLTVDVVLGVNYPDSEGIKAQVAQRPGTTLYQNIPTLAELSARADLVIGAGGATTWERMCLGIPSLVISVAENQDEQTSALMHDGYQLSLINGLMASSEDWSQAILQLIKNPASVIKLARKARQLVDGLGTKRVTNILLGNAKQNIKIRRACATDEELLLRWANDSEARVQSFHQGAISEEEHAKWFAKKLNDSDSIILIGEDENKLPLGLVRFDIDRAKEEALISISIDQSLRGLGFSGKLLQNAISYWHSTAPGIKLVAEVRDSNWRSQRLFTQLQFKPANSRRAGAMAFELESIVN